MKKKLTKSIPLLNLLFVVAIVIAAFFIGTKYENDKNEPNLIAEAARTERKSPNIFESYGECSSFKKNLSDTTPPTVTIVTPVDGETVTASRGTSVVWFTIKSTDDNGQAYPSLYVNDSFAAAPVNMNVSYEDPSLRIGYFNVSPNKTYVLKAKACDSGGNETWSAPITITTAKN